MPVRIGTPGPTAGGGFVQGDREQHVYADGMHLYQYVGSNPVAWVDPTGCWRIKRWNGSLGWAFAEKGDTINSLADQIGLDRTEYDKWLTTIQATLRVGVGRGPEWDEGKGTGPITDPTKAMGGCEVVRIPNTVLAYWAGDLGAIGKALVGWSGDKTTLYKRGFMVVDAEDWTGAQLKVYIGHAQADKILHGLFVWGHGNTAGIGTDVDHRTDPLYFSYYYDWAPHYRLGLGILFACNTASARAYFAQHAIFWGKTGTLVPGAQPKVSKIIPPGAQGTNR